jgi:hypothetical protein
MNWIVMHWNGDNMWLDDDRVRHLDWVVDWIWNFDFFDDWYFDFLVNWEFFGVMMMNLRKR